MKKKTFVMILMTQIIAVIFCHETENQFVVSDGENKFHLLMPVSEVYRMLGNPDEIQVIRGTVPNHEYDTVILSYPGMTFVYYDFFADPAILVIGFSGAKTKLGCLELIGLNSNEVQKKYGSPRTMSETEGLIYLNYAFRQSLLEHIEIQFRFSSAGICSDVMLTHSYYYY